MNKIPTLQLQTVCSNIHRTARARTAYRTHATNDEDAPSGLPSLRGLDIHCHRRDPRTVYGTDYGTDYGAHAHLL